MAKNNAAKNIDENKDLGLQLNPKTMGIICVVLVAILILAGTLTQVLPRGQYDTVLKDGYETVVDGTYHTVDEKMPIWKILLSPVLAFTSSDALTGVAIILIIVLVGGAFLILDKCGTLKYIMASLIKRFSNKKYVLLASVVFACMLLASTAGILEELVTLVPIAVAVSLAMGWDSLVGLGMSMIAVAFGFTAATFNPFNVATVQKLSDIPVFSGLWLRVIIFAFVYLILFLFLFFYAKKIEKDPTKSLSYESDKALRDKFTIDNIDEVIENKSIKKGAVAFLTCICIDMGFIILDFILDAGGMISLPAMAVLFTTGGLLAGYKTGLRGKKLANSFFAGAKTIAPAIPLIIFIIAITYILREGMIMHTLLHSLYELMKGLSPYVTVLLLFAVIALLEFFIGSGTAKAFLIIPLVAPLSDLVGITRQTVVTTFCMADGFTNLLYPTSGIMIIAIGLVNVSYGKWLKFSWKLFIAEFVFAVAAMMFMVAIQYT